MMIRVMVEAGALIWPGTRAQLLGFEVSRARDWEQANAALCAWMPEDAEPTATATPATAAAMKRAAPESDTPSPVRAGEDWCGPGDNTRNDNLSSTGLRQKVEHGAKTQKQLRKEVKRLKLRVEKADSAKRQAEDKANRAREAQAAMEIRCTATLLFQDEADARGVGDFVTGIAKAFIDGKIEWDGFQKHLFDNCVRNTTGSRHNSYNDDFMNHMSILRRLFAGAYAAPTDAVDAVTGTQQHDPPLPDRARSTADGRRGAAYCWHANIRRP